jgi:hypothetical protein
MCSASCKIELDSDDIGINNTCVDSRSSRHYDVFKQIACGFCAVPANAHAALPFLSSRVFSSCQEQLSDIGVFVHAGNSTMGEASRAALALAMTLPATNIIIATDVSADSVPACVPVVDAGIRVMQMPDDDDSAGVYGTNSPWKKAQSRFPHALAAAVAHMPRNVKWIISQDSDTALNIPAIAAIMASQESGSKVIFGCVYEHVRQLVRKAHHGGGAGMIFSRSAAESIVEAWRAHLPHSAPRCTRSILYPS